MKFVTLMAAVLALPFIASGQETSSYEGTDPVGMVSYYLPSTSLSLEVEAVQETFHAGPYAAYAAKYLGMEVRQKDNVSYSLSEIRMTPYVEADQNRRFMFNAKEVDVRIPFLRLTSAGLIATGNTNFGVENVWRFPKTSDGEFADKGILSNLTTAETTLYGSVKKESSFGRTAVRQDMLVEKSEEKRAAELADIVFGLREKRMAIITGDTDATYSGEAMGAAIAELSKLEKEYLSLFTGYSEYQIQKMKFDLIPEKDRENQMYVAFRISDNAGLLPADNLSGKPVIMEISVPEFKAPEMSKKDMKPSKEPFIVYRVPAVCTVKIRNGADVVMQSRVPIYQLGHETSVPASFVLE